MAWTTPVTAVVATKLPAADWNASVRDNLLFLGTRKGFRLRRAANQSITDSTTTSISWDTEDVDSDGYGTVPATTYSIPSAVAGLYCVTAVATFSTSSNGTQPFIRLISGGITYDSPVCLATGIGTISVMMPLVTSDTVDVRVFQNSGSSKNVTAVMYANFVGR